MEAIYSIITPAVQKTGEPYLHIHARGCADMERKRYGHEYASGWESIEAVADYLAERVDEVGYKEGYRVFPCANYASGLRRAIKSRLGE